MAVFCYAVNEVGEGAGVEVEVEELGGLRGGGVGWKEGGGE